MNGKKHDTEDGKMKRRTHPTVLSVGSVSHGTLKAEDLIEAFLSALDPLRLTQEERTTVRRIQAGQTDMDDANTLMDIAGAHVPDFTYFGSHEGDGADFGVWVDWSAIDGAEVDGNLVKSTDPTPPTDENVSHYLNVNDHGNVTLYRRAGNRWIECWSVV